MIVPTGRGLPARTVRSIVKYNFRMAPESEWVTTPPIGLALTHISRFSLEVGVWIGFPTCRGT